LRTILGHFFLYDFDAMVHEQQWGLQLHLYYHLHTVDKHVKRKDAGKMANEIEGKLTKKKLYIWGNFLTCNKYPSRCQH
jgi:hypothetical protein